MGSQRRKIPKNSNTGLGTKSSVCKKKNYGVVTRRIAREMGIEIPSIAHSCSEKLRITRGRTTKVIQLKKLDTNLFESYLETLWKNISEDKRNSCTYLDCLWFSMYKKGSAKTKVLMWIKQKHIFSRKYVFVPIVCWRHWSLLILCHFGENFGSETRTPCMLLLDSLEMTNPKRLEPDIRKFVLDIFYSEGREEKEELISKIPLLVPKVPQQRNGVECGIFVLYFIILFLESAPEDFSIFNGYPYFMKEDWFDFERLVSFYRGIRQACG